ncbi:MAG: L-aspartate oxidase [Oscillospiraceae bacterium]|nr:L-aspartate oxidase [Oscillospiraceae bacterium]
MRYIVDGSVHMSGGESYDVVIIGAGIAGLYTALNVDSGYSCCVLAKETVEISNSWLAQGGIAAAISRDDDPELHYQDTLIAGAGLCDSAAVRVLVDEGPSDIMRLVSLNVPFDLNDSGDLRFTREGGHRMNRIVHAGGDATGRETVKALAYIASQRPNITLRQECFFTDVLTDETGAVSGVAVWTAKEGYSIISTRHVVIATGGIGQAYKTTTNPEVATGDGIAAAIRAGAQLQDIEFIQIHPTGLWSSDPNEKRAFLISEAVRGEGGLLKNKDGERFMLGKHELNELAPRDIVARAIVREMERTGDDHVFVDITAKDEEFLSARFPTIYNECLRRGINIAKDWIPVCPVQHYLIGGIKTDLYGRTTVPGLYACGEAASTGVHGANRLASNSMLECLVFGRRAATDISYDIHKHPGCPAAVLPELPKREPADFDYAAIRSEVQALMTENAAVIRTQAGLMKASVRVKQLLGDMEKAFAPGKEYAETLNVLFIADSILDAALARRESVGAHYREN